MRAHEITAALNPKKKIIEKSRKISQAMIEFADNLEQIERSGLDENYCRQ